MRFWKRKSGRSIPIEDDQMIISVSVSKTHYTITKTDKQQTIWVAFLSRFLVNNFCFELCL